MFSTPLNTSFILSHSCPHITPQPEKPGKIFWFSGPPGAGKSTTCQLLARKHGYIYYEANATEQLSNPFVDIHVEDPSLVSRSGKSLKVRLHSCLEYERLSGKLTCCRVLREKMSRSF